MNGRAAYKKILEDLKETDPELYQIYALGEYATLTNIIYQNYRTEPTAIDSKNKNHDTYYGLDFGFNHPTALVQISDHDGETHVREIIYQSHLTNRDLINLLQEQDIPKKAEIYADAAEPARIEEIYRAGYNIHAAEKKVSDGIDSVKRCRLRIHEKSVNLLKEIRTYKWKEDKNGNLLDEPIKFNDDLMDATRYGIHTHGTTPNPNRFKVVSS
jgi:phage terminase large subunit